MEARRERNILVVNERFVIEQFKSMKASHHTLEATLLLNRILGSFVILVNMCLISLVLVSNKILRLSICHVRRGISSTVVHGKGPCVSTLG